MSNYGQINPTRPRRPLQNQSGFGSSQGAKNAGTTQQRLWYSCHSNNYLEATSLGGLTHPVQRQVKLKPLPSGSGRNRSPFISADWTTQGRERLSQKKITDELTKDRRYLIDPTYPKLSLGQQCELLGISRSSYYYQSIGESAENLALMLQIDKLFTARPELGVRRMHQELTTPESPLNLKRIRRLMRLMGLEAVYPKPNLSKPNHEHKIYPYLLRGVRIECADHVWSTDITYIPMKNGFLYLCAVIDWYSRFVLSWQVSNTLLIDFCLATLQQALDRWGKPANSKLKTSIQCRILTRNRLLEVDLIFNVRCAPLDGCEHTTEQFIAHPIQRH
jgi:hypothetical protein